MIAPLVRFVVGVLLIFACAAPAAHAASTSGGYVHDWRIYSYDAPAAATTSAANAPTNATGGPRTNSPHRQRSTFSVPLNRAAKAGDSALSQAGKRRLAKRLGDVPRSSSPVAQGGSAKTGRWWEYDDVNGQRKIVVEHPDGTVHVGIPKPQSTHTTGGPPKYYDYGNYGHVGE